MRLEVGTQAMANTLTYMACANVRTVLPTQWGTIRNKSIDLKGDATQPQIEHVVCKGDRQCCHSLYIVQTVSDHAGWVLDCARILNLHLQMQYGVNWCSIGRIKGWDSLVIYLAI